MDLQMEKQLFQGNDILYFILVLNLQMENQLLQGNQAALGSPLGRSITLVNDILYTI